MNSSCWSSGARVSLCKCLSLFTFLCFVTVLNCFFVECLLSSAVFLCAHCLCECFCHAVFGVLFTRTVFVDILRISTYFPWHPDHRHFLLLPPITLFAAESSSLSHARLLRRPRPCGRRCPSRAAGGGALSRGGGGGTCLCVAGGALVSARLAAAVSGRPAEGALSGRLAAVLGSAQLAMFLVVMTLPLLPMLSSISSLDHQFPPWLPSHHCFSLLYQVAINFNEVSFYIV